MDFHKTLKAHYSNWGELENAIEQVQIAKEKGTIFEEFVFAYFERLKDIYQIDEIYMSQNIPEKLRQKYRFEKRDSGVDGLIIKYNGDSIAYQVKFRSRQYVPSYDDLTSFWAESEYTNERCIISNCYELPKQSYKKKNQFVILQNELNGLDQEFFNWLYEFCNTGNPEHKVKKFSPLPHQNKMIKEVIAGFSEATRGKMLAACGTGKTLAAMWIKEELNCSTTLFVAPNLGLIKQTLEAWMPNSKSPFSYLCVCSDETVVNSSLMDESDELLTDMTYIGVPVTTDPEVICEFLKFDTPKDKVIFSTYQSLDSIVNAIQSIQGFKFSIAFFDEAHKTAGKKDSVMFLLGMDDVFIPIEKRLFMTATERYVSPRIIGKAQQYSYEVFSMDNEEDYGKTFTTLSFRDAIEQNIISDYKIVLCCLYGQDILKMIESNILLNIDDHEINAKNLFKQVLLGKTMSDIGIHKIISYHQSIRSAQEFICSEHGTQIQEIIHAVDSNIDSSEIYADHINGRMSAGRRKDIFDTFVKSPLGIISNAKCLTEGIDVPIIDAVYFADPKDSIIDIIQAVGRSLRITETNPDKVSYIIVPVIIDDDVMKFEDINPKDFSTLHSVVQALRDQDRILADYIDRLNLKLAQNHRIERVEKDSPIVIELSERIDIDDFANKLSVRVAEVNKDSSKIDKKFIFNPGARASGIDRTFKTVGDYTLNAYYNNLIIPTLNKYTSFSVGLLRDYLTIDHNNVSHTRRIGAIIEKGLRYYVSEIGEGFFNSSFSNEYIAIFKEQMLKYYELAPITRVPRFPYRLALKVLSHFREISKFEFVYSIYCTKDFGDKGLAESIERINYLKTTFPHIEVLNENNKTTVLQTLNEKYTTSLRFEDIWTSKTTVYNQFNYIKNHLFAWDDIFDLHGSKNEIRMLPESTNKIQEILNKSREIEICPMDQLAKIYTSYKGWKL